MKLIKIAILGCLSIYCLPSFAEDRKIRITEQADTAMLSGMGYALLSACNFYILSNFMKSGGNLDNRFFTIPTGMAGLWMMYKSIRSFKNIANTPLSSDAKNSTATRLRFAKFGGLSFLSFIYSGFTLGYLSTVYKNGWGPGFNKTADMIFISSLLPSLVISIRDLFTAYNEIKDEKLSQMF